VLLQVLLPLPLPLRQPLQMPKLPCPPLYPSMSV
jgi:hypothetical protein